MTEVVNKIREKDMSFVKCPQCSKDGYSDMGHYFCLNKECRIVTFHSEEYNRTMITTSNDYNNSLVDCLIDNVNKMEKNIKERFLHINTRMEEMERYIKNMTNLKDKD